MIAALCCTENVLSQSRNNSSSTWSLSTICQRLALIGTFFKDSMSLAVAYPFQAGDAYNKRDRTIATKILCNSARGKLGLICRSHGRRMSWRPFGVHRRTTSVKVHACQRSNFGQATAESRLMLTSAQCAPWTGSLPIDS